MRPRVQLEKKNGFETGNRLSIAARGAEDQKKKILS
jgi:hypothetical protein